MLASTFAPAVTSGAEMDIDKGVGWGGREDEVGYLEGLGDSLRPRKCGGSGRGPLGGGLGGGKS